jgi:hypothetical protein
MVGAGSARRPPSSRARAGALLPSHLALIIALTAALLPGACASDPAAVGITGPAPNAEEPDRAGAAAPARGGVVFDPNEPAGSTRGRFWRYN